MESRHITEPAIVHAAGNMPKLIEEFIGRVNSGTDGISVARMKSPGGWREPGQTPAFDEYTLVLRGTVHVETQSGAFDVAAGQAFAAAKGEWMRYSSPDADGAEYISICVPAFSPEAVNRDA